MLLCQHPDLSGIYIGPADLSLAIGEDPSFDKPESSKTYNALYENIRTCKKNKIIQAFTI